MKKLAILFLIPLITACTVTPKIRELSESTYDGGAKTSGVLACDPKTGNRTVSEDLIRRYVEDWPIYHTVTDSAPIAYTALGNGKFILDAQHFADFRVMNNLKVDGIDPNLVVQPTLPKTIPTK